MSICIAEGNYSFLRLVGIRFIGLQLYTSNRMLRWITLIIKKLMSYTSFSVAVVVGVGHCVAISASTSMRKCGNTSSQIYVTIPHCCHMWFYVVTWHRCKSSAYGLFSSDFQLWRTETVVYSINGSDIVHRSKRR